MNLLIGDTHGDFKVNNLNATDVAMKIEQLIAQIFCTV